METVKKLILLIAGALIITTGLAAKQPNIVIIFNDDQGYQDLGCFGSPNIKTPRVDQLAREGMRFTDFLVASPVCSASRAALMTGRYPQVVGVQGVFWPDRPGGLEPEHVTIAETLKRAGYATAAVGKWHLGDKLHYLPTNQGFDSYYGIPYSNDMYPASDMKYASDCLFLEGHSHQTIKEGFAGEIRNGNPRSMKNLVPLMRNEECIEFPADQATITRRFADEGIEFISRSVKAGKPFFLYLANSMPHIPLFASEQFLGKSERGLYGDVIEEIDYNTGRIMDHLKKLGIEENTIVIFTSDNGPWLTVKERGGSALPLFEGKFTGFEGGQRVPFVIRWPARIPAGTVCSEVAASIDIHPTLAKVAGAKLPDVKLDGKNVLNLWTGKKGAKSPHKYFFYVHQGQAVRSGDWKYHKKEVFKVKDTARDTGEATLYNLRKDIGEANNVIDEHPEIAGRLAKALDEHLQRISKK
jgi:arylsulfatase A